MDKIQDAISWLEKYKEDDYQAPEVSDWIVRQALHVLKGEEEEQ